MWFIDNTAGYNLLQMLLAHNVTRCYSLFMDAHSAFPLPVCGQVRPLHAGTSHHSGALGVNMTANILVSLPSRVAPAALAAPASHALSGGKVSCASDLLKAFTADVFDTTRLSTLKVIAGSGITCEEFKAECKQAQKLASETDALAGFVMVEGAKGQDQYGPIRRVLNQRLSEAKNVFGVLKADSSVVAEKGWFPAVEAARAYFVNKGVKWDGSTAPTDAQKESKAQRAALSEVMQETLQEPGESLATYMGRCASLVEVVMSQKEELLQDKAFAKLLKDIDTEALLTYMVNKLDIPSLQSLLLYTDEQLMTLRNNAQGE